MLVLFIEVGKRYVIFSDRYYNTIEDAERAILGMGIRVIHCKKMERTYYITCSGRYVATARYHFRAVQLFEYKGE